jgi:hypothetical protein
MLARLAGDQDLNGGVPWRFLDGVGDEIFETLTKPAGIGGDSQRIGCSDADFDGMRRLSLGRTTSSSARRRLRCGAGDAHVSLQRDTSEAEGGH